MRSRTALLTLVPVLVAGSLLAACGSSSSTSKPATTTAPAAVTTVAGPKDIVDTAVAAGQFKTLATALTAAGLIDTLKGPGPFTVFAPTDAAFAKVDAATLAKLLANKEALTKVLTYHVVAGKVTSADIKPGMVKSLEGSELMIAVSGGKVMVDKATVTTADVMASNGVIHIIDTVLIPADVKL